MPGGRAAPARGLGRKVAPEGGGLRTGRGAALTATLPVESPDCSCELTRLAVFCTGLSCTVVALITSDCAVGGRWEWEVVLHVRLRGMNALWVATDAIDAMRLMQCD